MTNDQDFVFTLDTFGMQYVHIPSLVTTMTLSSVEKETNNLGRGEGKVFGARAGFGGLFVGGVSAVEGHSGCLPSRIC